MTVHQSTFEYTNYSSFIDLFESQVARYHENVYIMYESPDTSELQFRTLTYGQFDLITTHLAHEWLTELEGVQRVGIVSDVPIQSLLAMFAVLKLGRIFFPISTGNSETTIIELLTSTDTQLLIASEEYSQIAQMCARELPTVRTKIWQTLDLEQLTTRTTSYNKSTCSYRPARQLKDVVLITQSSGTSGHPKPIYINNQSLVIQILNPPVQERCNRFSSMEPYIETGDTMLSTSAVFHSFGLAVYLSPLTIGAKVFMFHKLPTCTQDLLAAAAKCRATIMTTSPANLEALAKYLQAGNDSEFTTAVLKRFKFCIYSGAPLASEVRNILHSRGLNVRCGYGSTEVGQIARSNFSRSSQHWDTLKPIDIISDYCHWEPFDDGLYHLMIRGDYPSLCPAIAVEIGPQGYYATNDLFREEPPMSGYWRLVKRTSDILVLSDGGKADPLALEKEIRKCHFVSHCIVVGYNKPRTAVLIELNLEQTAGYQPNQIISEVHESVQIANKAAAQAHSIISVPDMIYILPPNRRLPKTPKGTIARKEALEQFEKEIDGMYDSFVGFP